MKIYRPYTETNDCFICLGTHPGGLVVAHEEGGEKHPVHEKCIRIWENSGKNFCPVCKKETSEASPFGGGSGCALLFEPMTRGDHLFNITLLAIGCLGMLYLTSGGFTENF